MIVKKYAQFNEANSIWIPKPNEEVIYRNEFYSLISCNLGGKCVIENVITEKRLKNIDVSELTKAPIKLKKYFFNKYPMKLDELIGLKVKTIEGDEYFITDIDQFGGDDKLPNSVWISREKGSDFGHSIDTDELYVVQ